MAILPYLAVSFSFEGQKVVDGVWQWGLRSNVGIAALVALREGEKKNERVCVEDSCKARTE